MTGSAKVPGKKRLYFSLLIFLMCLLFTFLIWDRFFNSVDPINRNVASVLILAIGFLFSAAFSAASGLFVWARESRQEYLEKELKCRTEELKRQESVQQMSTSASTGMCWLSQLTDADQNLDNLLESVMELVKKVLQMDGGSLMLLDANNELYIAKSSGIDEEIVKNMHLKIGEKVVGNAAQARSEFLIIDGSDDYPEFKGLELNRDIHCSIVCPLLAGNLLLGVLNLSLTEENFTELDLRYAMIFSSQVAQAILNNRGDIPHRVLVPQERR